MQNKKCAFDLYTPSRRDGVEFVKEENAWLRRLRPLKKLSNRPFTAPNVLVQELWPLHTDEVEPAFLSDS